MESTEGIASAPPQSTAAAGTPSTNIRADSSRPPFSAKRLWFWSVVAVETPVRTSATPAVAFTSTSGLRAFTGSCSTSRVPNVTRLSAVWVSTSGAAADTSTLCVTSPMVSVTFTSALWLACN